MDKPGFPWILGPLGALCFLGGLSGYSDATSQSHKHWDPRLGEYVLRNEKYIKQRGIAQFFIIIGILIILYCIYDYYYKMKVYREYEADPETFTANYYKEKAFQEAEKRRKYEEYISEKNAIIEKEREEAIQSQQGNVPWEKRFYTYPCPYCGHYKVRAAKWDDKRMSVAFWGVASSKIGTRFKCENCGKMWS